MNFKVFAPLCLLGAISLHVTLSEEVVSAAQLELGGYGGDAARPHQLETGRLVKTFKNIIRGSPADYGGGSSDRLQSLDGIGQGIRVIRSEGGLSDRRDGGLVDRLGRREKEHGLGTEMVDRREPRMEPRTVDRRSDYREVREADRRGDYRQDYEADRRGGYESGRDVDRRTDYRVEGELARYPAQRVERDTRYLDSTTERDGDQSVERRVERFSLPYKAPKGEGRASHLEQHLDTKGGSSEKQGSISPVEHQLAYHEGTEERQRDSGSKTCSIPICAKGVVYRDTSGIVAERAGVINAQSCEAFCLTVSAQTVVAYMSFDGESCYIGGRCTCYKRKPMRPIVASYKGAVSYPTTIYGYFLDSDTWDQQFYAETADLCQGGCKDFAYAQGYPNMIYSYAGDKPCSHADHSLTKNRTGSSDHAYPAPTLQQNCRCFADNPSTSVIRGIGAKTGVAIPCANILSDPCSICDHAPWSPCCLDLGCSHQSSGRAVRK